MGFFDTENTHYIKWRETRIKKLVSVFGIEWFKDKKILELACGHGHIGQYFRGLGADVTFTDGNDKNIPIIQSNNPNSTVLLLDQDETWNLNTVFDLVIHWGVLYHLKNWQNDLITAIKHSKILTLETEILDIANEAKDIQVKEHWFDGAINRIGSRMTSTYIENIFRDSNVSFTRYDDEDLNAAYHKYDWKDGDCHNTWKSGMRRFWIIRNNQYE